MRETFDTAAALYDRARPRYPAQLFADLARHTGLPAGSRALEIATSWHSSTVSTAIGHAA